MEASAVWRLWAAVRERSPLVQVRQTGRRRFAALRAARCGRHMAAPASGAQLAATQALSRL